MKINTPQTKALELAKTKKFVGFSGGYRSGKTFLGCINQCQHFYKHPRVNQGYFAPTYPQIRDIYYPTIEEVASALSLPVDIKEGNKEVHFGKGRFYRGTTICRSMERPGTIIGFSIGNALIDEVDTLKLTKAYEAYRKIIARLSWSGARNGAMLTTTPEGFGFMHHLFVSQLEKKPELRDNYALVVASTYENEKNLPDGYIDSLIEIYPAELVDAYVNGEFVNLTSGTVYNSFNRKTHNSSEVIKGNEPLHIGMDFNVGQMAAKVFVIRESGWHCVQELYDIFDTPAMIDTIEEKFPGHKIYIYPDASGDSRKTNNASMSDIGLLEAAKFIVRANPSNPRVKNRVMSTNKQFQIGQLFVNVVNCARTAEDLEQQSYDTNGEPDKKSGNDHGNDAFGYPIAYTFPIVKPAMSIPIKFVT